MKSTKQNLILLVGIILKDSPQGKIQKKIESNILKKLFFYYGQKQIHLYPYWDKDTQIIDIYINRINMTDIKIFTTEFKTGTKYSGNISFSYRKAIKSLSKQQVKELSDIYNKKLKIDQEELIEEFKKDSEETLYLKLNENQIFLSREEVHKIVDKFYDDNDKINNK